MTALPAAVSSLTDTDLGVILHLVLDALPTVHRTLGTVLREVVLRLISCDPAERLNWAEVGRRDGITDSALHRAKGELIAAGVLATDEAGQLLLRRDREPGARPQRVRQPRPRRKAAPVTPPAPPVGSAPAKPQVAESDRLPATPTPAPPQPLAPAASPPTPALVHVPTGPAFAAKSPFAQPDRSDGRFPGEIEPDLAELDRLTAFINRWYPMLELERHCDLHARVFPASWMFRAVKRCKAKAIMRPGWPLLRLILMEWLAAGTTDRGPEDHYDDEMNLLKPASIPAVPVAPSAWRGRPEPKLLPLPPEATPEEREMMRRRTPRKGLSPTLLDGPRRSPSPYRAPKSYEEFIGAGAAR